MSFVVMQVVASQTSGNISETARTETWLVEADGSAGFVFGDETDNNRSFGVVLFSVQKHKLVSVTKRFRCLVSETWHMRKSQLLLLLLD